MKIRVQYYSYLRDAVGRGEEELQLNAGDTAGRAMELLCSRYSKLAECRKSVLLAIGLEWVKPDAQLNDGDVLSLMPPVQGGAANDQ